ncbi:MAG: hypothetical protein H0T84_14430 [Tatlockia sp.]|nr:hypothetical protein [Tatlockia sp.]
MSLRREQDDEYHFSSDYPFEEEKDSEKISHKREVRKILEERLERKRLKEEFDELDGEFDWDEFNR